MTTLAIRYYGPTTSTSEKHNIPWQQSTARLISRQPLWKKKTFHRTKVRLGLYQERLVALSSDTTSQHNVFRHNGYTLGVNGAKVAVLKQTDQVRLQCFLQR